MKSLVGKDKRNSKNCHQIYHLALDPQICQYYDMVHGESNLEISVTLSVGKQKQYERYSILVAMCFVTINYSINR